MQASRICIILTLHCVKDRVHEYKTALTLWNDMSTVFKRVVTVDSANNEYLNTTHALRMYHKSPSFGEKMSLLAAMPSLLDCPFIFKWTGRYYSDMFPKYLKNIAQNSTLVLQSRTDTRGQNSEVFGATLDELLIVLSLVKMNPYTPMETALRMRAASTRALQRLPYLSLVHETEQKSTHRKMRYV